MIFHPAILALLLGSILISLMLLYSCAYGISVLLHWNIQSGSEMQLSLERRTYLISTIMSYALVFQLLSLFLFIYTVDNLSTLFVGAMCAAGTLNVNSWGYPTLVMKIINFILAGVWLVINYTDNRGYDYPLIKKKYLMLLLLTPFLVGETIIQGSYFLGLVPDVITSCCGALFTSDSGGATSGIVALPRRPVQIAFAVTTVVTFILGLRYYFWGKNGYLFSAASTVTFLVSIISLISFISLYFYELPTHHCPFCIMQREYRYVGYPIYSAFLVGAVSGLGMGVLALFDRVGSLREVLPRIRRQLTLISLSSYLLLIIIVGLGMAFSNLRLEG